MDTSIANVSVPTLKRSISSTSDTLLSQENKKRPRTDNLLTELSDILVEIKATPSSGEISADLLNSLRLLMLQIESLAADETNIEAKTLKDESDNCLELWFQELVAQCEADGEELVMEPEEYNAASDNEDEEDTIALALALQDEEDYCKEFEKGQICIKKEEEDDDEEVEVDIL
ncbi:hypothetical protein V8B55DRAFT_1465389 [Mucor lusitanicus]|uniref:Uncharacterized protein n=2 Tax=Mucor circinelloides f. lusitanicus TaxID=29924 RepID=A0A162QQ64_MUCCL|nr:hypothetical protein FB192DRAFT_1355557 [Mucor lusitanicus]OAD01309.1 hypothetical protein MUCCIDRAFT_112748 [Mucor lusitanicus CBS 277.49]